MVSTFIIRQKVDLRRTFYFDTQIAREVRIVRTCFQSGLAQRYVTVRKG